MVESNEDLQPNPLNEGGGMGRLCRKAKALNRTVPPGQLLAAHQRALRVKIREGPPGEKHLLPDVKARGKPPARGQPILLNNLYMSVLRRRIFYLSICPSGAERAKLYPNDKAD